MGIAIMIVTKNRIFLTIKAIFLMRISVRKMFWATVIITAIKNSCRIVADVRPIEPSVNSVEMLFASSPIIRLKMTNIRTITPNIVKSCLM